MLNRMSVLAMLSLDGTKSDSDRALYENEFTQLSSYITNVGGKEFNGVTLFSSANVSSVIDSEGTAFNMTGVDLTSATYTNVTSSTIATTVGATSALSGIRSDSHSGNRLTPSHHREG